MGTTKKRNSVVRSAAFIIVALLAAGCVPYWDGGASLTVSGLTVSWPEAIEVDDGEEVAYYEVRVDGVPAGLTTSTSCTLRGLGGGTSYEVMVRIVDTAGESSSTIGGTVALNWGTITATVTPGGSAPELVPFCVGGPDNDGDGLPNVVETNNGNFQSLWRTGTNPNDSDTDGDGINDGDEILGTVNGLNLPGLGTSALHQDLLLEYDWFDDTNGCGAHSHRPNAEIMGRINYAFGVAPRPNPDGTNGINVINDYGQGGLMTGGNLVPDGDGVIDGFVSGAQYQAIKAANFAANRNGYFHYVLMPHNYDTNSGSSGQAEVNGDDMIVSLQCSTNVTTISNTIAHELGHNLGLRHGGNNNVNWKPNYNSVMNYRFQFGGVDIDCDALPDATLNFSSNNRIQLNENNLNENAGTCGGTPIDWNGDGTITNGVSVDINANMTTEVLNDFDDWANIFFGGISDGDGAPFGPVELISELPVPPEYIN